MQDFAGFSTALAVLAHCGQSLPIYQFALLLGESFIKEGKGEVVSKALELLGGELPPALYRSLAESFAALDSPVACSGIVNAIVEGRMTDLYSLLEDMLARTRSADLHRYGAIMLAASREPDLTALLYVPYEAGEENFVVRFNPQTNLIDLMEAMRYRDVGEGKPKILWITRNEPGPTLPELPLHLLVRVLVPSTAPLR